MTTHMKHSEHDNRRNTTTHFPSQTTEIMTGDKTDPLDDEATRVKKFCSMFLEHRM